MLSRKEKENSRSAVSTSSTTSQTNTVSVKQSNGGTITESRSVSNTVTSSSRQQTTSKEVVISGSLLSTNNPRSIWDNNSNIQTSMAARSLSYNSPTSPTKIVSSSSLLQTDANPFIRPSYSSAAPRIIGYNDYSPMSPSSALRTSNINTNVATGNQSPFRRELQSYHSYRPTATTVKESFPSTISLPSAGEKTYDPRIPTYKTTGKKRAKVLIINNVKFLDKKNEERTGAVKDETDLVVLLNQFGFDVKTERNLKCSEMKARIKKFRSDSSLKSYDISIVIIMSHGNNYDKKGNRVKGGYTEIYGIDNDGLHIDEILNEFSSEVCPYLNGKPKIFIFQCCRGDNEEKIATDAAPIKSAVKSHADMLLAFSTLPGFSSNRDPKMGTWYIQSIIKVFEKHAKAYDIEQLLKIVDNELSNRHPTYKQTSTYESRGFKRCYLNPK